MSDYVNHTRREGERQAPSRKAMQLARHAMEQLLAGEVDEFRLRKKGDMVNFRPMHEGKPESA